MNQPVRDSHRDGFVPIEDAELADDVAEVKIHRAFGDLELVADFGADHAASGQLQALAFACRERTSLLERRDTFFDDIRHENGMKHRSKIHDTRGDRRDHFPIARIQQPLRAIQSKHDLIAAVSQIDCQSATDAVVRCPGQKSRYFGLAGRNPSVPN